MALSKSGRVVIVDNKYEEVVPLIQALGKQGVPYLYYNGKLKQLPDQPITGIRFIFLDIELDGTEGKDNKSKASTLVAVLKKLIGVSNEPYVIIFWTTHHNIIPQVLSNCKSSNISPVAHLDLDKGTCLTHGNSIQKIMDALDSKLMNIGAFQLYTEWENLVHNSASELVGKFSSISKARTGEKWSNKTAALFNELYENFVGKGNLNHDNLERFKLSCHVLNRSHLGILDSDVALNLEVPSGLKICNKTSSGLDAKEKANLNRALFIGNSLSQKPSTGDVYIENNEKLLNDLKGAIFTTTKPETCKLCKIVLTPECDIAQGKTLKFSDDQPIHRIMYGLLYEGSRNTKGALYSVGPFTYNEKSVLLQFVFSMLTTCKEDMFIGDPMFTLKSELCFDLMSKAANNVNRLGEYQF